MKKYFFKILILFVCNFCYGQEMTYIKGGSVSLNNEIIKKPKKLYAIIKKQNSIELLQSYKRYIRYKRGSQFFGALCGMGFINSVDYHTGVPTFDYPFVVFGLINSGITALFNIPARRALKKVVENYNYNLINEKYSSLTIIENNK